MATPARLKGQKGTGGGDLEGGYEVIWGVGSELREGKAASGHGEATGTEGTGASDVVRGIPNDDDILGSENVTGVLGGTGGAGGDPTPVDPEAAARRPRRTTWIGPGGSSRP